MQKNKTWFEHIFWYNYAYLMQKLDMLHSKISKHTVITQKSYFSWAVTALVALFKWIIFLKKTSLTVAGKQNSICLLPECPREEEC